MNSLHKIFFVGVVILSIIAGSHFSGVNSAGNENVASIIISASDKEPVAENSQPAEMAQPATSNDSTTSNDIQTNAKIDVLNKTQGENSEGATDNGALLKTDSTFALGAFHKVGSEAPPDIQARAGIVADLKTGQPYFELNPNLRWPTASLAKLMTAIMALKNIDLSKPITLTGENILSNDEATTSTGFFRAGDVYSGNDVLAAMLIVSKNEAAEALANTYGRANFIAGLNSLAKDFGMSWTNFSDPTGLSVSDQSTANDLKKLALNIYRDYPKIFEITRKKSGAVTELGSRKRTALSNINIFAGTSGFVGGKTGYTDDADGNLLSVFSYNSRPILAIVLGTGDRFGETEKLMDWFEKNYK